MLFEKLSNKSKRKQKSRNRFYLQYTLISRKNKELIVTIDNGILVALYKENIQIHLW